MGDDRVAHPDLAEDVDIMILEHLIYTATKGCIDDFLARKEANQVFSPSHTATIQVHILNGKVFTPS